LIAATAFALGAVTCGGKSPGGPTETPPAQTNVITITASGVNPKNVQITPGSRVRFVNNDAVSHYMTSDPHPEHNDCVEINEAGFLLPQQSRETGNLNIVRTCGFHDHDKPEVASLKGSVVIKQ
jgi:plastocyanin